MRGVETRNRVDNLVIREVGRSTVQEGTSRRSPRKRSKDWKNGIRVRRSHGKHVICRRILLDGGWRAGNETIPKTFVASTWEFCETVTSDPQAGFYGPILKLKKLAEWRGLGIVGVHYLHRFYFSWFRFQNRGLVAIPESSIESKYQVYYQK